ncbi:MAG: sigma-70 family RNA polymerase sigma factor [Candidatus Eiseniibacteriota bacterium]|jgi:RNA polymerase sigma factor (sigma-70 family)
MNDGHDILELIDRDPEAAWRRLVDTYSGLILALIARYTPHQDARMDAYLYVLEQLAMDDMRRIRRYGQGRVARPCQFTTWLKLVVRNLYFDWFRHRHGRKSVPKEIQKLSEREQRTFKLVYWDGHSPREAFEVFRTNDPKVTYEEFLEFLSEVDGRLTGINRAKIHRDYLRAVGPLSLDLDPDAGPPVEAQARVESVRPDREAELAEQRRALWALLSELPPEEQLLIRLRFYEGMTAKQIAAAIGSSKPMEIYRRIERTCQALARQARQRGLDRILEESDYDALGDSGLPAGLAGPGAVGEPDDGAAGGAGDGRRPTGEPAPQRRGDNRAMPDG